MTGTASKCRAMGLKVGDTIEGKEGDGKGKWYGAQQEKTMSAKWFVIAVVWFADIGAYFSVPAPVRADNKWALVPGGGVMLFSAYHFGNKINTPNLEGKGRKPA